MTPEETARFHADRPGFELIDFTEVCLPVFKIYMVASLLLHTPLPPIYEFVLRAIRIGIDDTDGVAACLGIPVRMVQEALKALHTSEEITFRDGDTSGPDRFVLTRRGEKTATSLERIQPEQQTIPVYFDGLTRRPIDPPSEQLLSGKQPEELGYREIPSLPPTRIEVSDMDTTAVAKLLARERSGEGKKDLLTIRSIERRMRLHLPATALVFRSREGADVELLFASETRMLDDQNRAFALAEGPKKTRLLAEFAKPDLIGSNAFARKVNQLNKSLDVPAKPSATSKTLRLPRSVAPGGLQRLTVLEHPLLLRDAVENAKTRVMIFSPWIAPLVMDGVMLLAIRKLLDRGVQLHIGYGLDEDGKHTQKPIPKGLQDLADDYQNFELRRFGDTHEKVLIQDDEFVALTSFNWLSFRGDPDRKLRRELGVKVTDPLFIESEYAVLEARFRAKPPKRRGAVEQ